MFSDIAHSVALCRSMCSVCVDIAHSVGLCFIHCMPVVYGFRLYNLYSMGLGDITYCVGMCSVCVRLIRWSHPTLRSNSATLEHRRAMRGCVGITDCM